MAKVDWIGNPTVGGGVLGYQGKDTGEAYIVRIRDKRPWLRDEQQKRGVKSKSPTAPPIEIRALLQEKVDMGTESIWRSLSAASVADDLTKGIAALLGRSPVNRWLTRRIWDGTSPLRFTLNLKFVAELDPIREVLLPCRELQRMCLPFVGDKRLGEYFLSPPGPLAFDWAQFLGTDSLPGGGEEIDVRIGKLLWIRKCVVQEAIISYAKKFDKAGNPLEATATMKFETYEIQTKESLDKDVYYRTSVASTYQTTEGSVGT